MFYITTKDTTFSGIVVAALGLCLSHMVICSSDPPQVVTNVIISSTVVFSRISSVKDLLELNLTLLEINTK